MPYKSLVLYAHVCHPNVSNLKRIPHVYVCAKRFTYHDPKVKPDAIENGPRNLMPFQDAIAFVVGGGNYIEYENLIEHLHGRGIVYGASALLGGAQFLESFSLSDPQP